jgi:ABC-type transporter Mla maintaining outer membrane lipid asymmetry ATPase subunit MlaF/ABC-type transporter Mla maintaining outer membrane lipid asymmetry permease subunit MlaE
MGEIVETRRNKQTTKRRRVRLLTASEPIIEAKNLSIQVGTRELLRQASFQIYKGEIVLLIGGSGAGKSILTKILMGLIHAGTPPFKITGELRILGKEIIHNAKNRNTLSSSIGIVFQDYGLFDEFSVRENIDFAFAHSPFKTTRTERQTIMNDYINELGIDDKVEIYSSSGGQKQRIAVARTLAYNPEIILYDEPTSGLDPYNSQKVADLIKRTTYDFEVTSVIVTHDYDFLSLIASRIFYLDAIERNVKIVRMEEIEEMTLTRQFGILPPSLEAPKKSLRSRFLKQGQNFLEGTTRFFEAIARTFFYLIPYFKSFKWGLKYFQHYFRTVSGWASLIYIAVCGIILGFVSTYFIFKFLPQRPYTEPLVIDEVLSGIGFALYRIIIPVMATILVAARCGAAVAADVGNRVYTKQTNAMHSLDASPASYLFTNILYAFFFGVPILTLLCFYTSKITSLLVFLLQNPGYSPLYWDAHFHHFLRRIDLFFYDGTLWVFAKMFVCSLGIASISFHQGIQPKSSGREVNSGITRTILWSTLFVLIVHFIFAFYEFKKPLPLY